MLSSAVMDLARVLRFGWLRRFGRDTTSPTLRAEAPTPAAKFAMDIPPELLSLMAREGIAPRIDRAEALQVPAVLRARNLIAGTLATLPLKKIGPDRRTEPWSLFDQPDPDVPTSVVFAQTFEDLLFEGVAWWRVTGFGWQGYPATARRIDPGAVHVAPAGGSWQTRGTVSPDQPFPAGGQVYMDGVAVPDREVIRFDSPNPPLLVHGARAIRTALRLDRTAATYADEPAPLGYFQRPEGADPLSGPEIEAILEAWSAARKRRAWGYVGGLDLKTVGFDAEQIQLADQRQHAVLEISRATGVDPEYLGVSTTTRTYANSEQRRQDLVDFAFSPYVSAFQDRLSMRDVTPRGHVARMSFGGFLRGDTKTRMETYKIGREVGAYTDEEIRELEDRPPLTPAQRADIDKRANSGASAAEGKPAMDAKPDLKLVPVARFSAAAGDMITFDGADVAASFRVNAEKRTISGLLVPWGKVARSGFVKWRFAEGSLHWADTSRIKANLHHDRWQLVAVAVRLQSTSVGLTGTFKVARGTEGDRALSLAEDKILDGFSIEVDFEDEDDWQPDPTDETVRLVRSGTLRGVALTGNPAFDDARLTSVTASNDGRMGAMPEDNKPADGGTGVTLAADQFTNFMNDLAAKVAESQTKLADGLTAAISTALGDGVKAALEAMHDPQADGPQPVRAARYAITREAPTYTLDGNGPSLVRDAWYSRYEHDTEAAARIVKFRKQTEDMVNVAQSHLRLESMRRALNFTTVTTSNASDVIPPGYRPDLFVPQLEQGRPLVNALSRGTISNATPFVVPVFASSASVADHVEGVNPTDGNLSFQPRTVSPGAVSGKLILTREIVDSSNPAIDQIALAAMREDYSQQTEAKVYTMLNGSAVGQGGEVTDGFNAKGVQVFEPAEDIEDGEEISGGALLLKAIREQLARYPFRRFASPDRALLSQRATVALANAEDKNGRPLLPSVGAQNASGLGNAVQVGWFVDGLGHVPAWAITGTDAGDADVFTINSMDAWVWESPLLSFRFEEKSGPALIELALFGYFATHLLRPVGLSTIRMLASDS